MYNIITVPSKDIRAIAREALRGLWKPAIIGSLIYYIAITIPSLILGLFGDVAGSFGILLYNLLVTGAFTYGFSMFCLVIFRQKKADYTLIFSGFEMFLKTLSLFVLQSLFIFLWTLLFIIPGIIAAFKYSQAFFILVDHPEYSASQCLSESKRMMMGNKEKLLCLELSFIGWVILAGIPTGCISGIAASSMMYSGGTSFAMQLISYIAELPIVIVTVYMIVASVVLYEMIIGNLVPRIKSNAYSQEDYNERQSHMSRDSYKNPSPYVDDTSIKNRNTSATEINQESDTMHANDSAECNNSSFTERTFIPKDNDEEK